MSQTHPNPRHAARQPAHIGPEQIARIRHGLHHLPQVVKPADYLAETHDDFEGTSTSSGWCCCKSWWPGSARAAGSTRR